MPLNRGIVEQFCALQGIGTKGHVSGQFAAAMGVVAAVDAIFMFPPAALCPPSWQLGLVLS